jgi:hypothetical protein
VFSVSVKIIVVLGAFYASFALGASSLTGIIQSVRVDKAGGGTFIQMENSPLFESASKCASPWAFIPKADSFGREFLSIAISSKMGAQPVRIITSGCVGSRKGEVPKVESIELGAN